MPNIVTEQGHQKTTTTNHTHVVTPINAFILAEHLPNAQLIMYPDSSHGAFYQHRKAFLEHVKTFLSDGV